MLATARARRRATKLGFNDVYSYIYIYIYLFIYIYISIITADKCPINRKKTIAYETIRDNKSCLSVAAGPSENPARGVEKDPCWHPPVGPLGRCWRAQVCKTPMAKHLHGEDKQIKCYWNAERCGPKCCYTPPPPTPTEGRGRAPSLGSQRRCCA